MLIEALANLAEKMGADRISLEIPPAADGSCAVMVVTSLGQHATVSESKENGSLVAAVAAPLVVEGHVGELDRKVVALIDDLEGGLTAASNSLPETDAQKRKRELKEAAAKKDEKKAKSDRKGAAKKGAKKTVSTKTDAPTKGDASQEDLLASGEAESL
jgi:hypothetical protein